MPFLCFQVLPGSAEAQVIWGGIIVKRLLIAYFIGNISAKKIKIHSHVSKLLQAKGGMCFWDMVYSCSYVQDFYKDTDHFNAVINH